MIIAPGAINYRDPGGPTLMPRVGKQICRAAVRAWDLARCDPDEVDLAVRPERKRWAPHAVLLLPPLLMTT
jgi:hypothetical protein